MARSEKITFEGALGEQLAARLDLPAATPRAFALFAHCFSCSKDVFAAARISQALCDHGIGVLRFDFTGLGASDGDFANTNFSSNVGDLLKAVEYLRTHHQAPALMIGHSLGGAAVIIGAAQVPEAKAVVTIGSPADTTHVTSAFRDQLTEIQDTGIAEVSLGGRPFTIKKQFVDDLTGHKVTEAVAHLRKAYLVMHAPLDEVVGIENATDLFVSAKHPKSFISLDSADHLITRRSDAVYAAQVIAAWAGRYIEDAGPQDVRLPDPADKTVTVLERGETGYAAQLAAGHHRLYGDQPAPAGDDLGPDPYELLALGLGLCTTQTLRMYATKKGLTLKPVKVDVRFEKRHREDCEETTDGQGPKILHLERDIFLDGSLDPQVQQRLLEIADRCPVHQTLADHLTPVKTTIRS